MIRVVEDTSRSIVNPLKFASALRQDVNARGSSTAVGGVWPDLCSLAHPVLATRALATSDAWSCFGRAPAAHYRRARRSNERHRPPVAQWPPAERDRLAMPRRRRVDAAPLQRVGAPVQAMAARFLV